MPNCCLLCCRHVHCHRYAWLCLAFQAGRQAVLHISLFPLFSFSGLLHSTMHCMHNFHFLLLSTLLTHILHCEMFVCDFFHDISRLFLPPLHRYFLHLVCQTSIVIHVLDGDNSHLLHGGFTHLFFRGGYSRLFSGEAILSCFHGRLFSPFSWQAILSCFPGRLFSLVFLGGYSLFFPGRSPFFGEAILAFLPGEDILIFYG